MNEERPKAMSDLKQ